jgi:glycosyltransferase involved in cell wall biosynthesis
MRAKWGRFASWYIRTGEKCAVRFADEIIVLSENVREYFREKYGRECRHIPNGVTAPERAEPDVIRDKYGLDRDSYLLYLGRLVPEKGIGYLIEAYQALDTDRKLVIAGGSSDTDEYARELYRMAEGDPRIIFTGYVEGRELRELYSNAYVYVLPSDLEGMPLSLLEAMSYGNCVITSDIRECTEVTGELGISFRAGDALDLRDKLTMLCGSQETVTEYKTRSAEYVLSRYSWDDVTQKTLALYRGQTEK